MADTAIDTAARTAAIAGICQAFASGDMDSLLKDLADDVSWDADWSDNFTQRAGVPMFTPRRGVTRGRRVLRRSRQTRSRRLPGAGLAGQRAAGGSPGRH